MYSDCRSSSIRLLLVVGTDRTGSVTGHFARWLGEIYAALGHCVDILDLAELPQGTFAASTYAEGERPAAFSKVVARVEWAEALVVALPEYNGGMPGAFKHWADCLPDRDFMLGGRPVAFIGIAAGEWGGIRPVEQAQALFLYRKSFVFPERLFIRDCEEALDQQGVPRDAALRARIEEQAERFTVFANTVIPLRGLFARVPQPG